MSHSISSQVNLSEWFSKIVHPTPDSHKGQNGKALIVGGSDLFHAASQWSFTAASRWVDMLFYSSVAENNDLLKIAKANFHDGVVIPRTDLPAYLPEVSAVLIGPGMRRDVSSRFSVEQLETLSLNDLTSNDWENDTKSVTVTLIKSFPDKKWVIDAGALQVLPSTSLPYNAVLTPHNGEFEDLITRWGLDDKTKLLEAVESLRQAAVSARQSESLSQPATLQEVSSSNSAGQALQDLAKRWNNATLVIKGTIDLVISAEQVLAVCGGNAGLTKGGTGDVLAGLILGLTTTSPNYASAVVAALVLKQSAHDLYQRQQEMFNSSDVVGQIPESFADLSQEK